MKPLHPSPWFGYPPGFLDVTFPLTTRKRRQYWSLVRNMMEGLGCETALVSDHLRRPIFDRFVVSLQGSVYREVRRRVK